MWLWIAIVIIGAVLAWLLSDDWAFIMRRRMSALGTVIDQKRNEDSESGPYFKAVVRFKAQDGRDYVITDYVGLPKPAHAIGARVAIDYPKGYPQRGRIRRVWVKPLIYALAGAAFLLLVAKRFGYLG